jgi:maltodextrin utilization protein YvdJ
MRWMNLIQAYWPAIAAMAFSLLAVGVISTLRHSSFGTELMASCWRALKTDPGCALNFDPPGVRG